VRSQRARQRIRFTDWHQCCSQAQLLWHVVSLWCAGLHQFSVSTIGQLLHEAHWFVPGTTPTAAQWTVTGKCIGAGDNLINPSLAAGTPVIYPSIRQNLLNVTGVVTLSTDGCTAGRVLLVKVAGNPTVAGTAISLIGVEITIRRSPLP